MPPLKEDYWKHAQLGLELTGAVLAGFLIGYQLDKRLGTAPWLMLGGAAAGVAGGFYLAWQELSKDGEGPGRGKK